MPLCHISRSLILWHIRFGDKSKECILTSLRLTFQIWMHQKLASNRKLSNQLSLEYIQMKCAGREYQMTLDICRTRSMYRSNTDFVKRPHHFARDSFSGNIQMASWTRHDQRKQNRRQTKRKVIIYQHHFPGIFFTLNVLFFYTRIDRFCIFLHQHFCIFYTKNFSFCSQQIFSTPKFLLFFNLNVFFFTPFFYTKMLFFTPIFELL